MDRTAWIIIGICAALLGLNIYMGNNKKAETAPIPAPQTAVAAANAPVAGVRPGAGTSAPEQASVNKALEEDKTAPITLVATQEVNGKQEPFITYTFNRIGGSIGTVTLHNDIVDSQKSRTIISRLTKPSNGASENSFSTWMPPRILPMTTPCIRK